MAVNNSFVESGTPVQLDVQVRADAGRLSAGMHLSMQKTISLLPALQCMGIIYPDVFLWGQRRSFFVALNFS